jgi:hypothetical protein
VEVVAEVLQFAVGEVFPLDGLDVLEGAVEDVDVAGVDEAREGGFFCLAPILCGRLQRWIVRH